MTDEDASGHARARVSEGMWQRIGDAAVAGTVAAASSGLPSTLHAMLAGRDPLEALLAAGSILLPSERRRGRLLLAAVPVHLGLSVGWALVLAALLPRRATAVWGMLAGAGIAALDLGAAGRRFPRVGSLPTGPQVADHVAYGAVVGAMLARRRCARRDGVEAGRGVKRRRSPTTR